MGQRLSALGFTRPLSQSLFRHHHDDGSFWNRSFQKVDFSSSRFRAAAERGASDDPANWASRPSLRLPPHSSVHGLVRHSSAFLFLPRSNVQSGMLPAWRCGDCFLIQRTKVRALHAILPADLFTINSESETRAVVDGPWPAQIPAPPTARVFRNMLVRIPRNSLSSPRTVPSSPRTTTHSPMGRVARDPPSV